MAWWKTNFENDIIDDVAADIVTQLMKDINHIYVSEQFRPPKLSEFIYTLAKVCNKIIKLGIIESDYSSLNLRAIYHNSSEITYSDPSTIELQLILEQMIADAIKKVSSNYNQTLNRIPRITEIFSCFSFVLGYKPENYLSEMSGKSVAKIENHDPK